MLLKHAEQFLAQILRLNSRQLFIYSIMTMVFVTMATLASLWFMTLWPGSQIQSIAKFLLAYTILMVGYLRFSYWLTA